VLAGLLLSVLSGADRPGRAAAVPEPPGAPRSAARADSMVRHHPRPFFVMLRSAAVPGLGQVTNHAWLKAIVVVAGEGYLGYRAWHAWRQELDAIDRANAAAVLITQAGGSSDPVGEAFYTAARDRYLADADRHYNAKINFIWWTAAAHLLQMADAYVDAHFVDFDAEFAPDDPSAAGGGPRITLALRAHF
jgi:hypothetical protein